MYTDSCNYSCIGRGVCVRALHSQVGSRKVHGEGWMFLPIPSHASWPWHQCILNTHTHTHTPIWLGFQGTIRRCLTLDYENVNLPCWKQSFALALLGLKTLTEKPRCSLKPRSETEEVWRSKCEASPSSLLKMSIGLGSKLCRSISSEQQPLHQSELRSILSLIEETGSVAVGF